VQRAWYRNILMHGFHFAVSTLCVRDIRDTQCGFKLFSRQSALLLFPLQHLRRWCFDVELLFLAQRLRLPVREVAVNWEEVPGSKLQLLESSLLMARDLCIIRACYATGIWTMDKDRDSGSGGPKGSKKK
jgi:dolichyl-phosphate beta-glucosyltransferase